MIMNSTPEWTRMRINSAKFVIMLERLRSVLAQLFGKFLQPHEIVEPLFHGKAQVLSNKGPIDAFLVGLDNGIGYSMVRFRFHSCELYPTQFHLSRDFLSSRGVWGQREHDPQVSRRLRLSSY